MKNLVRKLLALVRRKPKLVPVVSQQALDQRERQQLIESLKESATKQAQLAVDCALTVTAMEAVREVDGLRHQLVQADPALQPVLDAVVVDFNRQVADIRRRPLGL